jgi:hypothetical protein
MDRHQFAPGEVLFRRAYREPTGKMSFTHRWVLEDSGGVPLAWTSSSGKELTLADDTRYVVRRGALRQWLRVINPGNNEPVLETRWGRRKGEPIKFRGHDLHYEWARLEKPGGAGFLSTSGFALRIMRGRTVALSLTNVKNRREDRALSLPQLGRVTVGEDILGPDTPLIASVGFALIAAGSSGGGGA